MRFTVFGSTGYIGSSLIKKFSKEGIECITPDLRNKKSFKDNLGHVIYAIGVPEFKNFPEKAIDAHVILLNKLLQETNFESFMYLSSTRVYHNSISTKENSILSVNPLDDYYHYNISKIMGEVICRTSEKSNVRIVRLSNVTGKNQNLNLFLPSIIHDAINKNKIILRTNLESQKDYVYINDVLEILPKIAIYGKDSIYNVANGKNISNIEIINKLQKISNCQLEVIKGAKNYSFTEISIDKIKKEFGFRPTSIIDKLEDIFNEFKK